jgi:hypothetical protein
VFGQQIEGKHICYQHKPEHCKTEEERQIKQRKPEKAEQKQKQK